MDTEVLDSILRLTRSLQAIEQHVYNLYLQSYTGLRTTSARSTLSNFEHIRGVLKSASVTDISLLSESITSDTEEELTSLLKASRLHSAETMAKAPQVNMCSQGAQVSLLSIFFIHLYLYIP